MQLKSLKSPPSSFWRQISSAHLRSETPVSATSVTVKSLLQKRQSIFALHPGNMIIPTVLICTFAVATLSSPVPANQRVLYDQRQEGDLNFHADLKNFVVMIIPTQTSTPSVPSGDILSFLFKTIPKRGQMKRAQSKNKGVPGEETMHFIESKTAPYHVDISRSKNHLAKLHPEVPAVINAEEIVIAKSPAVELVKDEKQQHTRTARAFLLSVPHGEQFEKQKDGKKRAKEASKSVLKLLGADYEQCGPGLTRDEEGVCRTIKN